MTGPILHGCAEFSLNNPMLNRLNVFTFLWAFQALVQHLRGNGLAWYYDNSLLGWLRLGLILGVFLRPRSLKIFFLFLVVSFLYYSALMPLRSVHITLEYLIHILLMAGIMLALADRPQASTCAERQERVMAGIAPYIRATLIIFYFFVVWHKLNHDFLDYSVSCAAELYTDFSSRLPVALPSGPVMLTLVIYVILALEALIPVLLFFRRTRKAGIITGLIFHFILGLTYPVGIKGFTMLLFVLYFVFTGKDFTDRLGQQAGQIFKNMPWAVKTNRLRWAVTAVFGLTVFSLLYTVDRHPALYEFIFEFLFWMPATLIMLAVYFKLLPGSLPAGVEEPRPKLSFLLGGVPVLAVFVGLNPYLGLRTEAAWSMFSNLRTEGDLGNHLFMPAVFKIAGYQDDLVEIISLESDGKDKSGGYKNKFVPYWQFLSDIRAMDQDFTMSYARAGRLYSLSRKQGVYSDPGFDPDGSPWLARKFLMFRRVDQGEKQSCVH